VYLLSISTFDCLKKMQGFPSCPEIHALGGAVRWRLGVFAQPSVVSSECTKKKHKENQHWVASYVWHTIDRHLSIQCEGALTSAPSFSRSFTLFRCPALDAGMRGVSSSQSCTFMSIFSSFRSLCTSFLSPSDAAPMRWALKELMALMSVALANCSCKGV
jgi:hypothetical protein